MLTNQKNKSKNEFEREDAFLGLIADWSWFLSYDLKQVFKLEKEYSTFAINVKKDWTQ